MTQPEEPIRGELLRIYANDPAKIQVFTTTQKSWLRHAANGMGIGSEFGGFGKRWRIVHIGRPYRPAGEKRILIDTVAIAIPRSKER